MKTITVKVELSIRKPIKEVFKAVLEPRPFFIEKASGPMKEKSAITWQFAEFPQSFDIHVRKIVPNKLIVFEWPRWQDKRMNKVKFKFKPLKKNGTTVYISESGWPAVAKWRKASYRNCMGWMHMACSLKVYLEYGQNLRKGSFDHVKF